MSDLATTPLELALVVGDGDYDSVSLEEKENASASYGSFVCKVRASGSGGDPWMNDGCFFALE